VSFLITKYEGTIRLLAKNERCTMHSRVSVRLGALCFDSHKYANKLVPNVNISASGPRTAPVRKYLNWQRGRKPEPQLGVHKNWQHHTNFTRSNIGTSSKILYFYSEEKDGNLW